MFASCRLRLLRDLRRVSVARELRAARQDPAARMAQLRDHRRKELPEQERLEQVRRVGPVWAGQDGLLAVTCRRCCQGFQLRRLLI